MANARPIGVYKKAREALLAIDPGSERSAYVLIEPDTYRPISFQKLYNSELLEQIGKWRRMAQEGRPAFASAVIETMVGSYGQIGRTTIDTAIMIGRLEQALSYFTHVEKLPRQEIKKRLCPGTRGNDKTVRDALIARFAGWDKQRGKGTKAKPDFFYGFAADVWAAYAAGVIKLDYDLEKERNF